MSDLPKQTAGEFLLKEIDLLLSDTPSIWKEKPITYRQFTKQHLKIEMTERQTIDAEMILGKDPERTFETGAPYNVLCLLAGKGSGKDILGATILLYCLYLLLCLKDPYDYFKFPKSEAIDMLIISFTGAQAQDISFNKVQQFVKHWGWLWDNFTIVEGDRISTKHRDKPVITILTDRIETFNNIRIIAEHSKSDNFEGYNVIAWVMSEASAFKGKNKEDNGWKVFNTLRTSSSTRFRDRTPGWKGMVCSWPRGDESTDFTFQLYEQAAKETSIYRDTCYPWQFKPMSPDTKWFDFEGIQVPIEHQDLATHDPATFKKMILAIPPKSGEQAMPPEILASATHHWPPKFTIVTSVHYCKNGDLGISAIIDKFDPQKADMEYTITVDLGLRHAGTAVALQHRDPMMGYVLDAIGAWTPIEPCKEYPKGVPVDSEDVDEKLSWLCKQIPGVRIGFDQWQSSLFMARLGSQGFRTFPYHVYERDYLVFRRAMAIRLAHILDDPNLFIQLNALVDKGTVDRPDVVLDTRKSKRMDLVDVAVGGYKIIMENFRPALGVVGGTFVGNNLGDFGGEMIPDSPSVWPGSMR